MNFADIVDEVEFVITLEPTHTDEDEAFYVNSILTGEVDEDEANREGEYMRDEYYSERDADYAADRWERSFWGD